MSKTSLQSASSQAAESDTVPSTEATPASTSPSTSCGCDADQKPVAVAVPTTASNGSDGDTALPTEEEWSKCADMLVLDAEGKSRPFKSLYAGEGVAHRQMIIFVRHFFCGNCQEYVRTLCASITPADLLRLPTPTFLTIVGCGAPSLISMYASATSCPFPIYTDPRAQLYSVLRMGRTLDLGPRKPDYVQTSMAGVVVSSLVQSLRMGRDALKGGDIKQVGGEVFVEGGRPTWIWRMRNTRDHAEVPVLRRVLGFADEDAPVVEVPLPKRSATAPVAASPPPPPHGTVAAGAGAPDEKKGVDDGPELVPQLKKRWSENVRWLGKRSGSIGSHGSSGRGRSGSGTAGAKSSLEGGEGRNLLGRESEEEGSVRESRDEGADGAVASPTTAVAAAAVAAPVEGGNGEKVGTKK